MRRNPFSFGGGGGGIKRTLFAGLGLAAGELAGDALSRVAVKFGVGKLMDIVKVPTAARVPALRIALGLFATPLLKMLRVPASVTQHFGAVNVASGLLGLTANMRAQAFSRVGLGDYELADVLVGEDGMGDVLVGFGDDESSMTMADYELADYELSGDFSDQSFYGSSEGYGTN